MAESPLAGKTALITGAGSGIGRAIAIALAGEGMRITLVGRRAAPLEETAMLAGGGHVISADVTTADGITKIVEQSPQPLNALVHSAGQFRSTCGNGAGLTEINALAPMRLTDACLDLLRNGAGTIVFINSTAGLRASPGDDEYTASKQALRASADALRRQANEEGVRVLSVFPGRTDTPMQDAVLRAEGRVAPAGRLLYPEDVATMVAASLRLPPRAEVSELTIRPSVPL